MTTKCERCGVAVQLTYECQSCKKALCGQCRGLRLCCSTATPASSPKPGWVKGGTSPELPYSEGDTSKQAAEKMRPFATKLRARVLLYLLSQDDRGATDDEGYHALGMKQVSYGARRNELMNHLPPLVYDSGRRRMGSSNTEVKVWKLTTQGRELAMSLQEKGNE